MEPVASGGGRNFLVLQHVCFLGAAAASVLKSWCRQRVTFACGVVAGNVLVWWLVCPALVGVVPEVVCCRLGRRAPT